MGARGVEWETKQSDFAALRKFATVTRRCSREDSKCPLVVAAAMGLVVAATGSRE